MQGFIILKAQIAVAVNAQLFSMTKLSIVGSNPVGQGCFRKENFLDFSGHIVHSYLPYDIHIQNGELAKIALR